MRDYYGVMPTHDDDPSSQPLYADTPYTEGEINALLHNNERKTAVACVEAFMEFMREHGIDAEEGVLTEEQSVLWREKEVSIMKWSRERRMAILALADTIESIP